MVLSISLWNEYSNLSHTLMMALQGGDKVLVNQTIVKIEEIMTKLYQAMDAKPEKDEQLEGFIA